jgi:hypothetical protein
VKEFNQKQQVQEADGDSSNDAVGQIGNYLWNNVLTMRKEAEPTKNAHGRGDMPQTDQVNGEFMKPKAQPLSESKVKWKLI